MKRLALIAATLLAFGLCVAGAPSKKTVYVSTPEEFLDAISSDRTIVVTESFNLTPALRARAGELFKRPGGVSQIYCEDNYDGPELTIANMNNISIVSGSSVIEIVVEPRYANVLTFEGCSDIELKGLTLGHTEEGSCDRGVLGFQSCKKVEIEDCDLYGCGTEGIVLNDVTDFEMSGSKIRDCSYYIMHLEECINVTFEDCQFFRNREYELVNVAVSENVVFENCMFANNEGFLMNFKCPVTLRNCVILHFEGHLGDENDFATYENCIIEDFFHEEMTIEAVYG